MANNISNNRINIIFWNKLLSVALAYFFYLLFLIILQQFFNKYLSVIISQLTFIFSLIILTGKKLNYDTIKIDFRINKIKNPKNYIYIIIAFILLEIFVSLLVYFQSAFIPDFLKDILEKISEYNSLLNDINYNNLPIVIFSLAIMPALVEELIFRGYLQKIFEEVVHYKKAIIITSIIFASAHFNLFNFLPLFFISIVIGFIAYYTNSVFPGMIIHFLINLTTIIVKLFEKSNQIFIKGAKIDFDMVFYMFLSITSLIIITKIFKKQNQPKIDNQQIQ